jgi:hypothetical protein
MAGKILDALNAGRFKNVITNAAPGSNAPARAGGKLAARGLEFEDVAGASKGFRAPVGAGLLNPIGWIVFGFHAFCAEKEAEKNHVDIWYQMMDDMGMVQKPGVI